MKRLRFVSGPAAFILTAGIGAFLVPAQAQTLSDDAEAIQERIGSGDPVRGNSKSVSAQCQGCHGADGNNPVLGSPKLAGQYADYMLIQLRKFQAGDRKHGRDPVPPVSDGEWPDITAYFAANMKMKGDGATQNQAAKNLFVQGDRSRDVLPCVSCHGQDGQGARSGSDSYPVIGGQRKDYLREQLLAWRAGSQGDKSAGVMKIITRSLTDGEIEALSAYMSGL